MNEPAQDACGCCEGIARLTPRSVANRAGLSALAYRVGTHAAFLETMIARLSGFYLDIPRAEPDADGALVADRIYPLAGLTTRAADDPAIALLDAWATVADVLTFYQERIANEGYLRPATERRSILELARLVGYTLRPGVASTVYLAYTIDENQAESVEIPRGARAQSVPGPGELPQSFETVEKLVARARWNNLRPRLTRPQQITLDLDTAVVRETDATQIGGLYLKGTSTVLKPNDPLLFVFGDLQGMQVLRRIDQLEAQFAEDRTKITLQPFAPAVNLDDSDSSDGSDADDSDGDELSAVLPLLVKRASIPPRNSLVLPRSLAGAFAARADTGLQILTTLKPEIAAALPKALANVKVTRSSDLKVYALRVRASPFGYNAPMKPILDNRGIVQGYEEWPLAGVETFTVQLSTSNTGQTMANHIRSISNEGSDLEVRIVLQRGAEAFTLQIPIDQEQIETTLGDLKVVIAVGKGGGEFPTVTSLNVTVDELKRAIVFSPQGEDDILVSSTAEGVQIQRRVSPGIQVNVSTTQRSVTIWLGNTELAVDDESLIAPNPLNVLDMDAQYDQIKPQSWAIVERSDLPDAPAPLIAKVTNAQTVGRLDYGLSGAKVTRLTLGDNWLTPADRLLTVVRGATVYAQSEELALAQEPIETPVCGGADDLIELDGLYDGLQSGRWLIVAGERADIEDADGQMVKGVKSSELVMLSEVIQSYNPDLPGDVTHTFIRLAKKLEYCFGRDKVTIYGNVAKATHGETRQEVLGSGDGSRPLQSFTLRQPPLTFVAAPTPAGAESTLKVYVNDVEWHEADALAGLGPTDRRFTTRTDDADKTTVIFGNGVQGARLPTGVENVRAIYRNGIGKPGNVRAEQISLLLTRPLGVKEVINPLRASGGADRESRDQARRNAPLAVMALDRLVSVQDYADFARTFAGIGKALAQRLSNGRRETVCVTIAGADDIPIDESSDLYRNLRLALRQYGDPDQPFQIAIRELLMLVVSANVKLLPDYLWEPVVINIRARLLDTFSFERRELGQDVLLSEVISTIQMVEGVAYVDVDVLGGIPEKKTEGGVRRLLTPKEITATVQALLPKPDQKAAPRQRVTVNLAGFDQGTLQPAQLAFLTPAVPDTLILNQV